MDFQGDADQCARYLNQQMYWEDREAIQEVLRKAVRETSRTMLTPCFDTHHRVTGRVRIVYRPLEGRDTWQLTVLSRV